MAEKLNAKTVLPVFILASLLCFGDPVVFADISGNSDSLEGEVSVESGPLGAFSTYLDEVEEDILAGNFGSAREKLENVLKEDAGNDRARNLLGRLDREESLQKNRKQGFSWKSLFGFRETPVTAEPHYDSTKYQENMEKARVCLENENFRAARKYVVKATEFSESESEAREFIAQIDTAEGLFREKNKIPSGGARGSLTTSTEEYMKEREKYESRKKLEDLEVSENIISARKFLKNGEYEKARNKAYKAWKKIPYDTEVSILIANINKAILLGPEGLKTDSSESEEIVEFQPPEKRDPMKRFPDSEGFGDIAGSLIKGVKDLFRGETFEIGHEYPSLEYSMDDCVEVALMSSQRMKFADQQVKLGETRIWELRRKLLPEVALKMEKSFGKIADPSGTAQSGATRHYQGEKYMAEIKHLVFDGFGRWNELKQAQANLEVIKLERERIHNDITEETQRAYYNLDKTIKAERIQEKTASRISEIHEVAKKVYEKGALPAVEYLKVKGLNMQADFQTISSRRDRDLARLVLVQAMNIDPDKTVNIKELARPAKLLKIGLQNCYNLALANSPDIRIKDKTIEYYNFEREIAKAKGWPKVEFMSNIGKAVENYQPMRDPADWGGTDPIRADRDLVPEWYAGIKASLPLGGSTLEYNYVREFWAPTVSAFRGSESATSYLTLRILDDLAYFTGVEESKVGFERSKYEYQKAKNDLAMQVKTGYFKYRKALLQMDVATAQVEHQKMFVAVLEERRKFGEMDLSRLVEEYVKLSEHQYGEVHGDAEYYISVMEINKAIGVMDYFYPWETVPGDRQRNAASLSEKYLTMARAELVRENFGEARKLAMKAAEEDTSGTEARNLLGIIDRSEGLYRDGKNVEQGG